MTRHLRIPQDIALAFLRGAPRANLFMPMGFGKTAVAETLVAEMDFDRPVLALGPLRVARKAWTDEASEWPHLEDLKVVPVCGSPEQRAAALDTRAHIHTMNYENVEWLVERIPPERWPFGMVIADESTRLKGFRVAQGAARARALSTIAHRTERWLNMTGTPNAQGLTDLWGPQWFIDRGASLGKSYSAFENRWFYKEARAKGSQYSKLLPFAQAFDEIMKALAPTSISFKTEEWFPDLAKPVVTPIWVEMPPDARRAYRQMARDLYTELGDGTRVTAFNAASKAQKLQQLATGAVYHGEGSARTYAVVHDEKIEALKSIVSETGGEPLLVAYEFVHEKERVMKAFPQARLLKTKQDEEDFKAGRIPLLLAHPKSAGHGLSLQKGGRILVRYGYTRSGELHGQILERIGPMRQMQSGFHRSVLVYNIIARDTIEDRVILPEHDNRTVFMDALLEHLSRQ